MMTAVSIPNDLFERAEALAKERGLSRSQLYAQALQRLIRVQGVTASFDIASARSEDESDAWGDLRAFRQAARRPPSTEGRRSR